MSSERCPYTHNEKLLLSSLVEKHKDIVENKKTDSFSLQQKQQEWDKISQEYNCQAGQISSKRTSIQLKKLWTNLKQKKRKTVTDEKHQQLLTGGGPPKKIVIDPLLEAIDVAAPHADVSLECRFDSTATFIKKSAAVPINSSSPVWVSNVEESDVIRDLISPPSSSASGKDCGRVIQSQISSGSTSSEVRSPGVNRAAKLSSVQTEAKLRVRKMKESIEQQNQLHRLKMEIEQEVLRKVRAEREKAELELQVFKDKHL